MTPAPEEMSTKQAAEYLSAKTGWTIDADLLYRLKAVSRGPVVEKRAGRLRYRATALDAFLAESGTDPMLWIEGWSRDVVVQLRTVLGYQDSQLESFVEALDPQRDDWDPDEANQASS